MTTPASFAGLLQTFFTEYLLSYKRASPQTVAAYRDTFRLLLQFLGRRSGRQPAQLSFEDLNVASILAFLDYLEVERKNSTRSRNARLAALRSFLRFLAFRNPEQVALAAQLLAIPIKRADSRLVGHLTREEIDALIAAPDRASRRGRRDHALLVTMYNTGARVSEIAAIRRSQIVFDRTTSLVLHGKGRKERSVPLWAKTARILEVWLKEVGGSPDEFAFPNARGRRLTRDGVCYILERAVEVAAKICFSLRTKHVTPHIIRHTTAMHLLQAGVDCSVIALWLGHESLETTHIYLEADLATKQTALGKLAPPGTPLRQFKANDALLTFLSGL